MIETIGCHHLWVLVTTLKRVVTVILFVFATNDIIISDSPEIELWALVGNSLALGGWC